MESQKKQKQIDLMAVQMDNGFMAPGRIFQEESPTHGYIHDEALIDSGIRTTATTQRK